MTDTPVYPFYTPPEAARIAGVSETTIRRWAQQGKIEAIHRDRQWYIKRAEFDAFAATYDKADQYTNRGSGPGIVISQARSDTARDKALRMCRRQRRQLGLK